jgi:peptidoglycan/xylan/chitin deacetylase (PgdA/CDA1 family)
MKKIKLLFFIGIIFFAQNPIFAQKKSDYANSTFLKKLYKDSSYVQLKRKFIHEFAYTQPGSWGEFVKGVDEDIATKSKFIAFTFDACGGPKRNGYDKELIDFLRKERIPATLFVTGKWIDANFDTFLELSKDTLFEIENHGFNHKPCSLVDEVEYGIHSTSNASQAFDELEANARKIEALTHRKPKYYRSATAFIDEGCACMASKLGMTSISFQVLSGDAVPHLADSIIVKSVMENVKPGSIVIMHFNHPEWNTYEALKKIIPKLRAMGYKFTKLENHQLTYNKSLSAQQTNNSSSKSSSNSKSPIKK